MVIYFRFTCFVAIQKIENLHYIISLYKLDLSNNKITQIQNLSALYRLREVLYYNNLDFESFEAELIS
jgi:hypothetical protein